MVENPETDQSYRINEINAYPEFGFTVDLIFGDTDVKSMHIQTIDLDAYTIPMTDDAVERMMALIDKMMQSQEA